MDDRHINEIWSAILKPAIQKILTNSRSGLQFEELYRHTYTIVLHKHGELLYKGTQETITEHLVGQVRQNIIESFSTQFLSAIVSAWNDYHRAMTFIRDILTYLDRVYVSGHKLEPVYNMGVILFRDNTIRYEPIQEHLKRTLLEMIDNERRGEIIENTTLNEICQILMKLYGDSSRLYEEDFLIPFIKQSTEFYQLESKKLLAEKNVFEYMRIASVRITEESERTIQYFDKSVKERVVQVVGDALLSKCSIRIEEKIYADIYNMLNSSKHDDVAITHQLFDRFPNMYLIVSDCLRKYFREEGEMLVTMHGDEHEDCIQSVEDLFELKTKFYNLWKAIFNYDNSLGERIKFDLKYLVNLEPNYAKCLSSIINDRIETPIIRFNNEELVLFFKTMIILHYLEETNIFEDYYERFRAKLQEIITNMNEHKNIELFVQNLLQIKYTFDVFVQTASYEKELKERLLSTLNDFINMNQETPIYISLFINDKLIKDNNDFDPEKMVGLLDYLNNKDIFERYYQRHLARRLLSKETVPNDSEYSMITALHRLYSSEFTHQLKDMCKDILVSRTTMKDFLIYIAQDSHLGGPIDLSVKVLTAGRWPMQNKSNQCNLPRMVHEAYKCFENFYLKNHSGRRLTLQSTLGTVDLIAWFHDKSDEVRSSSTTVKTDKERNYMLQVSTLQMVVLMLFNTKEKWSFQEIQEQTLISEEYLQDALLPLISGKETQKILLQESDNSDIHMSTFHVNHAFVSKLYKVKLKPSLKKSEHSLQKQEEIRKEVDDDRVHKIKAAIVRIMKTKKTMNHTELIEKVINELRTTVQPSKLTIKQCIERLIESAYLSRSNEDPKIYNYVA